MVSRLYEEGLLSRSEHCLMDGVVAIACGLWMNCLGCLSEAIISQGILLQIVRFALEVFLFFGDDKSFQMKLKWTMFSGFKTATGRSSHMHIDA